MIVEYHHSRYQLDAQADTDNYAAHLLFSLREDAPEPSEVKTQRFLSRAGDIALFGSVEIIGSGVLISGTLITPPAEEFYRTFTPGAARLLGPEGMKPENLLRGFVLTRLQQSAAFALDEFEEYVDIRDS